MSMLAAIRPDSWNFPLLVHAAGAMLLVGGLLTGASLLTFARGSERMLRLGYYTLLAVALPGYVVMRIGAQWIYSKEGWDDLPDSAVPTWIDIGFIVADVDVMEGDAHGAPVMRPAGELVAKPAGRCGGRTCAALVAAPDDSAIPKADDGAHAACSPSSASSAR